MSEPCKFTGAARRHIIRIIVCMTPDAGMHGPLINLFPRCPRLFQFLSSPLLVSLPFFHSLSLTNTPASFFIMVKLATLISAAVLVTFVSVVDVQAQGANQEATASQPKVHLTLIPNPGEGDSESLTIPRDACHFIPYPKWKTLKWVKVDSPNTNCVIYMDTECEKKVNQGTSCIGVPRKANTIRCGDLPQ